MTAPAIGIDLGTTYSCVSVYRNGKSKVIADALGNRVIPSVVAFGSERLIGDAAKEQEALNPENTIYDVKRLIGRRFNDPSVQRDIKSWPFEVIDDNGLPKVRVTFKNEQRTFFPEEISAMVLSSLKTTAEEFLGKVVRKAVITVPAHFTDSQRQATKDAATIAGLKVLRIINEPTAAALAYGVAHTSEDVRKVLVFDLGGGTFDVSVLFIKERIFEVSSTAGDTHLGGTDFDARLVEYLAAEFQRRHGINLRNDINAIRRLRTASERAKRMLSVASEASVELDALHAGLNFCATVTRPQFEELCGDLFRATLELVLTALNDAKLQSADIDEVVLVGGSIRIPAVQAILREVFANKQFSGNINPDEAVAKGAAVQAAILDGDCSDTLSDLVITDVTPLSLGVSIAGDWMTVIIPRNVSIPCEMTRSYTSTYDNQTEVNIEVYAGEKWMTKDNYFLGKFTLTGLIPAPKAVPKIKVTFEIDWNGILNVSAIETISGQNNKITIINKKVRLSSEQISKLIREAKAFKDDDAIRRLRTASERAKRTLSVASEASVELDALHEGLNFMSRACCEDLCRDLFRATLEPVEEKDEKTQSAETDEVVLAENSAPNPAVQAILRKVSSNKRLEEEINLDKAVAIRAADANLDGDRSDTVSNLVIIDVTPRSLGVNIAGDRMSVIIPRDATIPCQMTRSYTSTYDNQTEVDIEVYEGERSMIKNNYFLGKFTLTGLIPAPKGVPKIEVTCKIDWNGIRNVSAIETISGQKNKITIINQRGRCSLEQIRMMIREAKPFKYDDERSAAAAEARNSLEQKCYDI